VFAVGSDTDCKHAEILITQSIFHAGAIGLSLRKPGGSILRDILG
jgi:hypothetical protein